jgi:uncharacterized protein (DUF924 family)
MDRAKDIATARQVLAFWFEELTPAQWWRKEPALDRLITARFGTTLAAAKAASLAHWRNSARGRLAELIVLDQFSRNVFRGRAESFEADATALALAREAVRAGADRELAVIERAFVYMPYMHSESLDDHREALRLFDQPGLESSLDFERLHHAIILRFGRYPHRNAILGRSSTPEELEFLSQPGSAF